MKVAIVHDWLVVSGGAEKVLEQMIACFPQADIFSLVDFLEDRSIVHNKTVKTSFIQGLPYAKKKYRGYLPLMPLAIEQFDLSGYDLVLSSSHAVAKGVLVGPDQTHVSYVHSPIRYAWDLQHQYLREARLEHGPRSWAARMLLHYLRNWDARSANGVDRMIANSQFVARRIMKSYRREAAVIAPPVDVQAFEVGDKKGDFYLTASRMVPYKRIDMIVEAFASMPDRKLVVIGDGPQMDLVRSKATSNVSILGYQSFEILKDHMQRAKAFVYAAEEDFGIAIVEAQACGTPVIAYGKGGALESVVPLGSPGATGLHFMKQTPASLCDAVERFEDCSHAFTVAACRRNAERFGAADFRRRFIVEVLNAMAKAGPSRESELTSVMPPAYVKAA